ncbi:uncharacterized protein LOC112172419 [Rosa chinensis]|uniref:uncharacterized protein LOC112172419 n=1 Tax=Rosa chinensis TaxID=74649 RepID=UPI000D097042|nr:uncharacterized protein LOC112172419 [Rosa chinensis]
MKIHIQGIEKWSYVTGSAARPAAGPKADEWDTANTNVMGILLKAMTPEVMRLFANYDSPKAIWDSVAATYYDGSDFARVHELNVKAFKITQSGQPVATFYANLKTIWQELDQRNPNPVTCEVDINSYRTEQDKMCVHIFLTGLDPHFEGAKNELLRLATPPTLEQAFAYIRRDEGNKAAAQNLRTEISSLAIHATPPPLPQPQIGNSTLVPSQSQYQPQNQGYHQMACNYCKEVGHFKNQCPKLRSFNYNNSGWRGGNNTGGHEGRGGGQRGKVAVQLVPEPDFYGIGGVIMGNGDLRGRLFHLDCMYAEPTQAPEQPLALTLNSDRLSELWLWHRRLGHPSFGVMKKSMPSLFLGVSESSLHCETCALAKSHRSSYHSNFHSSTMPFELIHSNVWGPSKHFTLSGMRYFVLFIDDCTRLSWVVLLMSKDSVFSAFTAFHKLVRTQYDAHVKVFRSDNGGEFVNHSFHEYFQHHDIIHQTSCPQTPEQNGVSERKNSHVLDMARSLLLSANMPKYLWGEAVLCASHLINRLPSVPL